MTPWYVRFSPLCPDNALTMVLCSSNIAPGIRTVTRSMCEQIQGWRKWEFFTVEVCLVKGESRTVQSTLHDPLFFFRKFTWALALQLNLRLPPREVRRPPRLRRRDRSANTRPHPQSRFTTPLAHSRCH